MPDDKTPVLNLPYILPNQAQKHVTHNEALRLLDVIVQLSVAARNLAAPPASPAEGDRHIVAAAATGDWAGKSGQIALFGNGAWQFFAPLAGWRAWIVAEQIEVTYTGTAWVSDADSASNFAQLGISTNADSVNRLAVSSPATLLNHSGAGHQLTINKSGAASTASLLFQTDFSARAEMGTSGSDDFSIKVSPDGSAFAVGLSIAAATGQVSLPAALRFGGQSSDPVAPPDGTIWLNATTGEVKLRSGGGTVVLTNTALGLADGVRGDITLSAGATIWTVNSASISNTKLASMATGTFKGRRTTGTGAPQDITASDAAQMLPVFSATLKGVAPASGGGTTTFLRADGTWAAPAGGGVDTYNWNAGASAPATPFAFMAWMDTTGGLQQLKLRNAANTAWVPFAQGAGYGSIGRNLLINAALVAPFLINQRGFNGTWSGLANGAYGYDRWFKWDATIRQRIEAGSFKTSTVHTISGNGIATQQVTSPASGHWELSFPNTATFLQVEEGTQATPFEMRPIGCELALCQRYFETSSTGNLILFSGDVSAGAAYFGSIRFAVQKRALPTITNANIDRSAAFPTTASIVSPDLAGIRFNRTAIASGAGQYFNDSWRADAEI
jgi:hypothetical protein